MSNICHNCLHHERCMLYRYNNIHKNFMIEIDKMNTKDGKVVIYVQKCSKFKGRKFKYYPNKTEE